MQSVPFRGLNTELYPNPLPSGTADLSSNIEIDGGTLKGRRGFSLYNELTSFPGGISNMGIYYPAAGGATIYLKSSTGAIYTVSSGTPITNPWTSGTGRGWFFQWADKFYHVDANGAWVVTTGKKAGIDSTVGAIVTAASGGEKEGSYRVYVCKRNSVTRELSRGAETTAPVATSKIAGTGGLAVTNFANIVAADTAYDYDQVVFYCTMGNTEATNSRSLRAYLDSIIASSAGSAALPHGDFALDPRESFTNAGGCPPACAIGGFNGSRAVYIGTGSDAGYMFFSVPRYPTMVPQERYYGSKLMTPRPWLGKIPAPFYGTPTAVGWLGGNFLVFTDTSTWWLTESDDGRLFPTICDPSSGALSAGAVVMTPNSVHVMGQSCWTRITRQGVEKISRYRFTPTIASLTGAVGAYYSFRNQVWMASGSDIYIWDEGRGELISKWSLAGLGVRTIRAISELAVSGSDPVMIVAVSGPSGDACLLKWPGTLYADYDTTKSAATSAYACEYRCHVGQERRMIDQVLRGFDLHLITGTNGLNVTARGMRCGSEAAPTSPAPRTTTISGSNSRKRFAWQTDPHMDGNLFQIDIASTTAQTAAWSIGDLIVDITGPGGS